MAAVLNVPVELILEVFKLLPRNDLIAVALSCKQWNRLATELLYNTINFDFRSHLTVGQLSYLNEPNSPSLWRLVRTLVYNPVLGDHIRYLSFLGPVPLSFWPSGVHPDQNEIPEDFEYKCSKLVFLAADSHHIEIGEPFTFFAAILSACHNLRFLELDRNVFAPHGDINPYPLKAYKKHLVLRRQLTSEFYWRISRHYTLESLIMTREVSMDADSSQDSGICRLYGDLMRSVCTCRNLKKMKLYIGGDDENQCWPIPDLPNMSELELHTKLDEYQLYEFISALPNLKRLELLYFYRQNRLELEVLRQCLDSVQKLEVLRLRIEFHKHVGKYHFRCKSTPHLNHWRSFDGDRILGTLGTMKEFKHLNVLAISPILLFGWDPASASPLRHIIPDHLKHLEFRSDMFQYKNFKWRVRDIPHFWERAGNELEELGIEAWRSEPFGEKDDLSLEEQFGDLYEVFGDDEEPPHLRSARLVRWA